jgi:hypothetical protein
MGRPRARRARGRGCAGCAGGWRRGSNRRDRAGPARRFPPRAAPGAAGCGSTQHPVGRHSGAPGCGDAVLPAMAKLLEHRCGRGCDRREVIDVRQRGAGQLQPRGGVLPRHIVRGQRDPARRTSGASVKPCTTRVMMITAVVSSRRPTARRRASRPTRPPRGPARTPVPGPGAAAGSRPAGKGRRDPQPPGEGATMVARMTRNRTVSTLRTASLPTRPQGIFSADQTSRRARIPDLTGVRRAALRARAQGPKRHGARTRAHRSHATS